MPTYSVINRASGETVYRYTTEGLPIQWHGMGFAEYDHVPDPAPTAEQTPNTPALEWDRLTFLRRFTPAERIACRTARASDPILDDFFSLLEQAAIVHANDPDVIAGLGYLVAVDKIVADRRDQILGVA